MSHPAGADSTAERTTVLSPLFVPSITADSKADHQTPSTGKKMKSGKGLLNPEVPSAVW